MAIYQQISRDSEIYARQVVNRLTSRSEQIAAFPLSGRTVPEYEALDLREVIEGHYRIIYRVKPDQIEVLTLVHAARLLPPDL